MATTDVSPREVSPRRSSHASAGYGSESGGDFVTARSDVGDFVTARTHASDGEALSGPMPHPAVYLSSSSNEDRAEYYSSRDPSTSARAVTMPFVPSPVGPHPGFDGSGAPPRVPAGYSITVDPSEAHRLPPSSAGVAADAHGDPSAWTDAAWASYSHSDAAYDAVGAAGVDAYGYGGDDGSGYAHEDAAVGVGAGGGVGVDAGVGSAAAAAGAAAAAAAGVAAGATGFSAVADDDAAEELYGGLDVADVFSLARHNKVEEVTQLLERGFPVNLQDEHGNTILAVACQNGLKRMAKAALRKGADMNVTNNYGNTPLHFSFMFGYGDSLGQYLISKGADASIKNNEGRTCFECLSSRK